MTRAVVCASLTVLVLLVALVGWVLIARIPADVDDRVGVPTASPPVPVQAWAELGPAQTRDNEIPTVTMEDANPTPTTELPARNLESAPTNPSPTTVSSTAYCETGRMADGEYAHDGAVSSKVLPRGSSWRVLDGPLEGRTFVVEDTGPGAYFDVSFPGDCDGARAYGRRSIGIQEVG